MIPASDVRLWNETAISTFKKKISAIEHISEHQHKGVVGDNKIKGIQKKQILRSNWEEEIAFTRLQLKSTKNTIHK